jgi:hypothetical protein
MIPMICFLKLFIDMIGGMDSMAFGVLGTEGPGKNSRSSFGILVLGWGRFASGPMNTTLTVRSGLQFRCLSDMEHLEGIIQLAVMF